MTIPNRSETTRALSVIVPFFNEARYVVRVIATILAEECVAQVVAVDDGSIDGGYELLLKAFASEPRLQIVRHSTNQGKGSAIRTGLALVSAPIVVVHDADLEYSASDLCKLVLPFQRQDADMVLGSRYLSRRKPQPNRMLLDLGVRFLNAAVWVMYGQRLTDQATCLKVMRTEWLKSIQLQCERFEFCAEVIAKACRANLNIIEVPIKYQPRSTLEGKKLRLRDGWLALLTLWRWRHWQPPPVIQMNADGNRYPVVGRGEHFRLERSSGRF